MVEQSLGCLFIVAAPSGGGKTSLVKELVSHVSDIAVSISHTTRDQRVGEEDGVHYFFVDDLQFETMVQQGLFIEHALVFDRCYGTSRAQIEARLQQGIDVVLDIDWQGAEQIKRIYPEAVGIFILPPSLAALKARLLARQQDDDAVIEKRMQRARDELAHYPAFDYLVVNDDFEQAASELQSIVVAHRLLRERQMKKQRELLSFLLKSS
ncbi:MAG: guanylate kinase [Legionellaceae bacterium]